VSHSQIVEQIRQPDILHVMEVAAGRDAERTADVGFTRSRRAKDDDIMLGLDVCTGWRALK
jgi:hypothetical protein